MVYRKLDQPAKAKEYRDKVVEWLDRPDPTRAPQSVGSVWDRAELHLMRQEAEALLDAKKP